MAILGFVRKGRLNPLNRRKGKESVQRGWYKLPANSMPGQTRTKVGIDRRGPGLVKRIMGAVGRSAKK